MVVERTPERRRGFRKGIFFLAIFVALIGAGPVAYVTGTLEPLLPAGGPTGDSEVTLPVTAIPTAPLLAPTPILTATPVPEPEQILEPTPVFPRAVPVVEFGEVSSEGWVTLSLASGSSVDAWYTFQVDTTTRDITLFFAMYNDANAMIGTVQTDRYTQGSDLDNAQVTLHYPDAPERVIFFEGKEQRLTESQVYEFTPYEPSIFSPQLSSSLIYYEVLLQDEAGITRAELNRDLSGILGYEPLLFSRSAPTVVERALSEIGALVRQLENQLAE